MISQKQSLNLGFVSNIPVVVIFSCLGGQLRYSLNPTFPQRFRFSIISPIKLFMRFSFPFSWPCMRKSMLPELKCFWEKETAVYGVIFMLRIYLTDSWLHISKSEGRWIKIMMLKRAYLTEAMFWIQTDAICFQTNGLLQTNDAEYLH